jgi:RHS repeat-associated protein
VVYTDPVRPHVLSAFAQNTQPAQTVTSNAYGEPATIAYAGQGQDTLLWNAQGKLYQDKNSAYSYDAFDQNTLVVTGSGSSQTSIVRVGDDFEYDLAAGRADKYFSVGGVRIAALATNYIAGAASIPPALRPALRRLEPLGAPGAAGFLLLGLVSLASVATRKRPPVWVSAPGVGVLSLVLVAMPFQAYAATLGSGGPGTFGRPAEPFLAYLTDHLGSVRAVVNSSGTVVETRDYDPFGADTAHTGTFSVQHRFTGQPADDQAGGLYNYGARFYNAKWGRFLSPDEVTQGFDSQGLNPFTYVGNTPTSAIDPNGKDFYFPPISIPMIGTLGLAMGAISGAANIAGAGKPPCGGDVCPTHPEYAELGGDPSLLAPLVALGAPEDVVPLAIIGVGLLTIWMIVKAVPPKSDSQENTEDQDTVIQWAKDAKQKGGISKPDSEALKDLSKEAGVPFRGPESHPESKENKDPHIHVGPVGHIKVW